MALAARRCAACTASTPPASAEDIARWSAELATHWQIDRTLVRQWRFRDFASALALANRIADVAEAEGHHPELTVGWGRLRVEIFTHAIGALSESDFVLAAKIDQL